MGAVAWIPPQQRPNQLMAGKQGKAFAHDAYIFVRGAACRTVMHRRAVKAKCAQTQKNISLTNQADV
jgi:hypothetical protein